ncbi:DNA helicase [Asanoa ishikariensis]|uniref:UvrD-helicase domain-containing protein n=1 Tax=Asanoa ishikariensis TaxID=137265 RepID=UPI0015A14871|nr:ATP-dependent helicase [Asanoa ishikariensis]GIF64139.1 DNA helicase [Asanoa ishikariensis]
MDKWLPSGVDDLEQAAWAAVRAGRSACVVAGPGAGKTELLAQRATFLLETGQCRYPSRILAISFKRDAAENLQARVGKRCPPGLSRRFTSVTFDAFTKGLVDRFASALPARWRLPNGYGDVSAIDKVRVKGFLSRHANSPAWGRSIAAMDPAAFESTVLGQWRLPVEQSDSQNATEFVANWWWFDQLRGRGAEPANLSFTMLNRLAELILRHNPLILRALRQTYPYVFIDECQDTSFAQYDFLLSVFGVLGVCVTAVGDEKQKIMEWAGAVPDVFARLRKDFDTEPIQLLCNYRSSPELVRIQHVLAQALDSSVEAAQSRQVAAIDVRDAAGIWSLDSTQSEARYVAEHVSRDMARRALRPRDYGLLVRQRAGDFEPLLAHEFANVGLRVRNEAQRLGRTTLQDLVIEPLVALYLGLLRLATRKRDRDTWLVVAETIRHLRAHDPGAESAGPVLGRRLAAFVRDLRTHLSSTPVGKETCELLLTKIDEFVDLESVAKAFPMYRSADTLSIVREAMQLHLVRSATSCLAWVDVLDAFEGTDCVPLMTVHKSKGLEFDTMVMIGLDDKTWWSYTPDNPEGLATFFVAVSRAKQRVVITHCSQRGSRAQVAPLFDLLRRAGVPETDLTVPALSGR